MSTVAVTDADFENEVLKSDTPVLVDFWAEWCPPCKAIAPALEELSTEFSGKVKIAKVNIEENPQIPTKYGVRSIPTLIVFKDGEMVSQNVGALSKPDLEKWLNDNL
jgi:thioredoxin 1